MLRGEVEQKLAEDAELKIAAQAMFQLFINWCGACNMRYDGTIQKFSKEINKIVRSTTINVDGKSYKGYMIRRDDAIAALRVFLKAPAWMP